MPLKPYTKFDNNSCSIVRAGLDIIAKAISEMLTKPKKIIASLRLVFRRNISQAEERRYLGVM